MGVLFLRLMTQGLPGQPEDIYILWTPSDEHRVLSEKYPKGNWRNVRTIHCSGFGWNATNHISVYNHSKWIVTKDAPLLWAFSNLG